MNKKLNHSPGPWVTLYSSNKFPSVHAGPTNKPIATLYGSIGNADRDLYDNCEANAKLISAAPELLAVALEVQTWAKTPRDHGGNPYCLDMVRKAEAILAKLGLGGDE